MTPLTKNKASTVNIATDIPFDTVSHQNLVCAFLTRGLSQKAFCAQHALKESTFKNWVYRYQKSRLDQTPPDSLEGTSAQRTAVVEPSSLFVPVHVTPDERQVTPMQNQLSRCAFKSLPVPPPSPLRLETGSFCITIPVGFDGDTLRSVLSIVQAYP
jgi:hypothetical protein